MDLNTFLDHFDTIAEAPGGIAKLKALILDLAVRGKLVPQDPEDEPASTILDKIAFSKRAVVKQAKSEKSKLLNDQKTETLFELPKSWQWAKLNDLTSLITDGEHATPARVSRPGVPLGTAKNIRDGFLDFSNTDYVSFETAEKCWKRCRPAHNDILMVCVGATTGRLCLVKQPPDFVIVRSVALIRPFENLVYPEYVALAINSPVGQSEVWGNVKQSAQPCLYINKMQILSLPTPPLAEQKRIVEKVDELMALCDRLAAAKQTRDDLRQKLRGSAIAALMNAETDEALEKSWAIVRDNWHFLSQDPKDVDDLRRSILQMAVRGKLEPQNSADKPSSKLLEEIQSQKRQLIQEKRIPKAKSLELIEKSETSYEIPGNWSWVRLGEISKVIEYGTSERASEVRDDVPVFRMNNIQNGKLSFNNLKYVSASIKDLPKLYLQDGDILFNRTNSYELVGKTGLFRGQSNHYTFASYLIRIVLFAKSINPEFINLVMNSTYFRQTQIEPEIVQQCGQANFNGTKLQNALIPLPPLAEQKRIVAKVDELMQMCDQLEESLRQSQQRASALAASAISHLTI